MIVLLAIAALAAAQSTGTPVDVHTSLTRTAIWIGERVTYTIELRCAPGIDVLLEDLGEDRLQLEGGEIVQVDAQHDESGERVVRRMRYTLTTYSVEAADVRIASLTVRYYARGGSGSASQAAPAGEVTIPAAIVGIRSTIAEWDRVPAVRHPAELRDAPERLRLAAPVGWALVAIAIVPVALWSLGIVGRIRRAWTGYAALRARPKPLSLDELRLLEPASDAARVEAYDRLDRVVRDHLQFTTGVAAHALTPAELRRALEQRAPALPHHDIEALLATCERARYAPAPPAREEWPRALREADQILRATK
jgi:hypothetical protein